jgi:hypothetical protein
MLRPQKHVRDSIPCALHILPRVCYSLAGCRNFRSEWMSHACHVSSFATNARKIPNARRIRESFPCSIFSSPSSSWITFRVLCTGPLTTFAPFRGRNTSWVQETTMPVARRCFAACEMAGGIYCLGGAGKVVFGDRRRNDESFVSVQRYARFRV